jgi:hypothetical protein
MKFVLSLNLTCVQHAAYKWSKPEWSQTLLQIAVAGGLVGVGVGGLMDNCFTA